MTEFASSRRAFLSLAAMGAPALAAAPGFAQSPAGASSRSPEERLRETTFLRDFGAVGDGRADDTAAFAAAIDAVRPGGTLQLGDGYAYRLTRSLVLRKPMNIRGGANEQNRLLFDARGDFFDMGGGQRCAIIALHEGSAWRGLQGDARRSTFSGFTAQLAGEAAGIRGFAATAPCYFYEVTARDFTSDGFAVVSDGGAVRSDENANGSAFFNCIAQANRGHGFHFAGDDSNACVVVGCRAFANGQWGFYDDSLIGNTFIAPEADSNRAGGFFVSAGKPSRSVFLGPYAETGQRYALNPRCLVLGPLGDLTGVDAVSLFALPSGDAYLTRSLSFAATADDANRLGDAGGGSAFARIGPGLLDLKPQPRGAHFRIGSILSPNYTDLMNGAEALIRFPAGNVTGNLAAARPYLPNGWIAGGSGRSGVVGAGRAAPTSGAYEPGAIWLNDAPSPGGHVGWICVRAGSPGLWKRWGAIEA